MRLGVGFEEKQRDWEVKVGACGLGGLSFQLRLSRRRWKDADVSLFSPAWVRAPQGLRPDLGPPPRTAAGSPLLPPCPPAPAASAAQGTGGEPGRGGSRSCPLPPPTSASFPAPRSRRSRASPRQRASERAGEASAGAGPLPSRHRGVLGRAPAAMAEAERG